MFENCQCLYRRDVSKEELTIGFKRMLNNEKLIEILDIVWDYETADEVLYQQLFEELKESVPLMHDYIDVFFRLSDDIENHFVLHS